MRASVRARSRVCAYVDPLNVTSQWFFGLIRLLLAAVSSLYCKGDSESLEEGGVDLPKKKSPDWQNLDDHNLSHLIHLKKSSFIVFINLFFSF